MLIFLAMRCSILLVGFVVFGSIACSMAEAQSPSNHSLQINKVKEKPVSEGMVRIAMQDLGCEPCEEVEFEALPGRRVKFLMNPQPVVYIDVRNLRELLITPDMTSDNRHIFQLAAHLTDDAAAEFDATTRPPFLLGITFFREQKLGIGPLLAPGGLFQIGVYATQAEAERVGRRLGLEPKLIHAAD